MENDEKLIPNQHKGGKTDLRFHSRFNTMDDASLFFQTAKTRLLDVSNWHKLCGAAPATFTLCNSNGLKVMRLARENDYFKINIPAPGNVSGGGYDWVQVEKIEETSDQENNNNFISITVRPSKNPEYPDQDTAHFFSDDATSTFLVKRQGYVVSAEVHGRNETPNTNDTGIVDSIRNAFVAIGAILGFSKPLWQKLVKGLVSKEDTNK